ncbi:hypothetical protein NEISICOT_02139 [Neisseria sicca ATCC 29256]|uniref:Uncharacterized protein n=1 Tax=Neisseria sicca ATCC 29256 TaxID=547045 RepID=C6M6I7_NEISI|nr:hypothetical protein NEISICOT_02139 [Neisseria sicca ATCC 29256]
MWFSRYGKRLSGIGGVQTTLYPTFLRYFIYVGRVAPLYGYLDFC